MSGKKNSKKCFILIAAVILYFAFSPLQTQAGTVLETAKLLASDGAASDNFGKSVSISGDYAIVGAAYDDDNGTNSGSAYIFKWNGINWTQQQKLTASDGATSDLFGYAVSISGDYAIVGAYGNSDNGSSSGSAYIFKRDGTSWSRSKRLSLQTATPVTSLVSQFLSMAIMQSWEQIMMTTKELTPAPFIYSIGMEQAGPSSKKLPHQTAVPSIFLAFLFLSAAITQS